MWPREKVERQQIANKIIFFFTSQSTEGRGGTQKYMDGRGYGINGCKRKNILMREYEDQKYRAFKQATIIYCLLRVD